MPEQSAATVLVIGPGKVFIAIPSAIFTPEEARDVAFAIVQAQTQAAEMISPIIRPPPPTLRPLR